MGVTKRDVSRIGMEKPTTESDSLVDENVDPPSGYLSTAVHANTVGS